METRTVTIPTISCMHCVMTIKRELATIEGIISVEGDHTQKQVTIKWQAPATWDEIVDTLTDIGYAPAE